MPNKLLIALTGLAIPLAAGAEEEIASRDCTATAALDYFQRGNEAQVELEIENNYCAASSGDFIIEVTIREDGLEEQEKLSFRESWKREDDSSFKMTQRYPIGDNVDLLRIRIRKLSCSCD